MQCRHLYLGIRQVFCEMLHRFPVTVYQKGGFRLSGLSVPGQQFRLIGVRGKTTDSVNTGPYRYLFAINMYMICTVNDTSGQCAACGIANKDNAVLFPPQIMLQVMPYPTTCAHARAGHDHSPPHQSG